MPPDSPTRSSSIEVAKRRLRSEGAAACAAVDLDLVRRTGEAAAARLDRDARWQAARRVGLFASTRGEPATRPILESAVRAGREVVIPRCPSKSMLEFAPVTSWDELRPGRYGLLEPVSEALLDPWQPGDVVIVPGLAFDLRGGRLGRGGGYYDRCFSATPGGSPWLLGLAFSFQIVSEVPMEEHDRRLDGVIAGGELVWVGDD